MQELRPEELEELVQELEGESDDAEEWLSLEVEELLRDLQPLRGFMSRLRAARQLGGINRSSRQVVKALLAAAKTDDTAEVRAAAAESLRAPVHQTFVQEHPELREAVDTAVGKVPKTARPAAPAGPWARFQVETQGDALCISWEPEAEQRKEATKNTGWVLLVSALLLLVAISTSLGQLRVVWILVFSLATLAAVYWIAAVWTNTTRISAGKEGWIFQRGPLPIPNGQFYIRPIRLDPAACKWVWTDRVEQYKLRWRSGGSSGSVDGPLGCLFALLEIGVLLSSIRRELVITHTLYARCADGSDRELLYQLSKREAEYLEKALQGQLDARDGQPAQG